jgi:hypothetical protein
MSRLVLRRGTVDSLRASRGSVSTVGVLVSGRVRPAISYADLTGPIASGDEVIVNTQAQDIGLSSGGYDIVHVNLTRGLGDDGGGQGHVMKLNYTSLQHAVSPLEEGRLTASWPLDRCVAVLALHGQLGPAAWQARKRAPDARIGYVQTEGGALCGQLSELVADLLDRGLICDHITCGQAFGGRRESVTLAGALEMAFSYLGWDGAICGPGPGIVGSASVLGHGGLVALDTAHASLALGCRTVLVPRMSESDPRQRHRGLSHHTQTVLDLLLAPVTVGVPSGFRSKVGASHRVVEGHTDIDGYSACGLPDTTMGRGIAQDQLFFKAALAGGDVLGGEIDAL